MRVPNTHTIANTDKYFARIENAEQAHPLSNKQTKKQTANREGNELNVERPQPKLSTEYRTPPQ
jgi:hypothetical protein